jgi:mono/diheme cytochrome c family protein
MLGNSHTFFAAIAALWLIGGPAAAADDPQFRRGSTLMNGIVACANCHAVRDEKGQLVGDKGMSGGMKFDDGPFVAFAGNITPDRETGIGAWTDQQLAKAIREGIRPDGTLIGPPMPIGQYRGMADEDLKAIIAYLRAQPAVKNKVPKSDYSKIKLPPSYGPPVGKVVAPPKSDLVRYGAYLAGPLGHCIECHTPMVNGRFDFANSTGAGGFAFKGPWGTSVSRNLTPHESGLKNWSDAEIARAIRTGVSRDGSRLTPPMAFAWYRNIGDGDMKALVAYLRSLKPLPLGGAK